MAAFHNYDLAIILLAMMIPCEGYSHKPPLKSLHFSLFHHETLNKTGYPIVNGVQGAGAGITETTAPFGTLFVFEDTLRATANRSSKIVGTAQGNTITSSFDGLQNLMIEKLTLRMKNHKGSISIAGVVHNINPSTLPVVGGTRDFLFVQGYITYVPIIPTGINIVSKIEFHLYWPPYATQVHRF